MSLPVLRSFAFLVWALAGALSAAEITVNKQSRTKADGDQWSLKQTTEKWQPAQTAIIVCDMWDAHHCLNAVRRELELAPRMEQVLKNARSKGVLIIHAPSSCMEAYKEHPARLRAQGLPTAANLPKDIAAWCRHIPEEDGGKYPIDQTDGGEDDDLDEHRRWAEQLAARGRNPKSPWKSQIDLLTIDGKQDVISDSGVEIWNLLEARGVKNVILMGVHTNMCVLGRPFGLRQMAKNGKNVVLMRDLTDTMYNPAKAPFVSHHAGTQLIVEHIEKFVCPTITSVDFVGGEPFRYSDQRKNVVMLIGDDEYKTEVTLPSFAETDLKPLGLNVTIVHSDPKDKNQFPGMAAAVKSADVVLVSVRRRTPPKEQLDALREHVAAGKPLVGIRTASHAWALRNTKDADALEKQGLSFWQDFDPAVFGGHYTGHHGAGPKTTISLADGSSSHMILRGVNLEGFAGNGSLYKAAPLAASTTPLLMGTIPNTPIEPVAWTNLAGEKKARVFYTSLGHAEDFESPAFRKLLQNGVLWSLGVLEPRMGGAPLATK
ncbi:Trehalose utilization [Anatilimnocola aggregata]|uniref:Trehalose utilization n=1 Tax=Anatilimnocola aggregata TaxID=2528021 RepID=A0A517YM41_9BACT|nr:ThuA domain-containing protein [Anatilimnocola aggregata]QDU31284.1 Trehalose utilization [Anatilimnocola aggregata]